MNALWFTKMFLLYDFFVKYCDMDYTIKDYFMKMLNIQWFDKKCVYE